MAHKFKFHKREITEKKGGKTETYTAICPEKKCPFLSRRSMRNIQLPDDQRQVCVMCFLGFIVFFLYFMVKQ